MNLKTQTIDTLKTRINEQDTFIKELTSKSNTAESTVKDIAIKALESSAKMGAVKQETEKRDKE